MRGLLGRSSAWSRGPALAQQGAVTQRASLHSSSRLLKREEKKQDKKLRIHLFDFDTFEAELRRVVGDRPVIKRRVASFEVFGGYHGQISEWLMRLGF